MSEHDIVLNIQSQQPSLNLYTQICLCYPVAYASLKPTIVETLSKGLERLAASFPWTAGNIVNEGASDGNTGTYKIRPTGRIPLVSNNLTDDLTAPTMEGLLEADFPISMLDENMLCPHKTVLRNSPHLDSESLPVFTVQANFISGGLILAFLGHHQAMDMVGQGQVMRLLSKACNFEQFIKPEVANGQLDWDPLVSLLDEDWKPQDVSRSRTSSPSKEAGRSPTPAPPACTWAYFTVDGAGLVKSRFRATATKPAPSESLLPRDPDANSSANGVDSCTSSFDFVSTDDLITAFTWQSIARARLDRLPRATESTLGRAVDVRSYLGIPSEYPGCMAGKTQHKLPLQTLVTEPLDQIALQLRKALDPRSSTLAEDTRKAATVLSRTADRSRPRSSTKRDLSVDVTFSSWRKVDVCRLDFGLGLGPPTVRRPKFEPLEGVVYIMPKSRGVAGDDVVAICLRNEDMERLKKDREFRRYAGFVG